MQDPQEKNSSFFDSRTMIAVLLVGGLFFGWQKYLEYKYPDYYKKPAPTAEGQASQGPTQGPTQVDPKAAQVQSNQGTAVKNLEGPKGLAQLTSPLPETSYPYSIGATQFEVSSKGMGLKKVTATNYFDREKKPIVVGSSETVGLFEVGLAGEVAHFKLEQIAPDTIRGIAETASGRIERTLVFDQKSQAIRSTLKVSGMKSPFPGLSVSLSEKKIEGGGSSIFNPSLERQEFTVKTNGKLEHVDGSNAKEAISKKFDSVSMLSLGSQYFAAVFVDQSSLLPNVSIEAPVAGDLLARLFYQPTNLDQDLELSWTTYAGAKDLGVLTSIHNDMGDAVNFGFFSTIGRVLLAVMRWFHAFTGNWGISIILLTLLVRLLVLPFNISSFKSMKRMQAIQPRLQSLRERYKNDPTTLNRETMALMKDEKVNPLGGCLPMLLQMPVFFALYQVLGQSIELYQAPFGLWIHDLSIKDPFYVLPVLMGITMFIQQKITPTTMDPAQAKVLQWMPVIFSVFTLGLPAGLTLYIFVSTLFGVIQQQLFMHDKKSSAVVSTASAK